MTDEVAILAHILIAKYGQMAPQVAADSLRASMQGPSGTNRPRRCLLITRRDTETTRETKPGSAIHVFEPGLFAARRAVEIKLA
jgi:hypothetical protein